MGLRISQNEELNTVLDYDNGSSILLPRGLGVAEGPEGVTFLGSRMQQVFYVKITDILSVTDKDGNVLDPVNTASELIDFMKTNIVL